MDLLSVVVKPTWKEFLIDLVQTKQMDPWDIDISAVAEAYLERVRELQSLDLRVPANVILACALMLRYKAETISFADPIEEEYYEEPALIDEELPDLLYRPNLPRRRGVTLEELITAVEKVMKDGERPAVKFAAPKELNLDLPKTDMDELMAAVYHKAHSLKDTEGVLIFSDLIKANTATVDTSGLNGNRAKVENAFKHLDSAKTRGEKVVYHLIPVLHLVQDEKLHAWQNDFFGEVFIKVLDPAHIPQPAEAKAEEQPVEPITKSPETA
jgi:chromatin segregation and condensation protein Rec8/ScpA/Scc1 (kleisin family)